LLFFAVAPETEEGGEEDGEEECEPCAVGHFGECRRKIQAV